MTLDLNFIDKIVPKLGQRIENYLGYHYWFFNQGFPDLNSTALEGIFVKSLEDCGEQVIWNPTAKTLIDVTVRNIPMQIKGVLVGENEREALRRLIREEEALKKGKVLPRPKFVNESIMELSSFRLGKFSVGDDTPTMLKNGILSCLNSTEVWYIFTREYIAADKLRVCFYECNKNSFLYNADLYNFEYQKKDKIGLFVNNYQQIEVSVNPSLSHQLWYKISFDNFNQQSGVKCIAMWEFTGKLLPREFKLWPN